MNAPCLPQALHIDAEDGAIAPTVLLPGDPLRAKALAEALLDAPCQVATCRNMLGFTGSWKGQAVSILGSGMGIPSCAIYATELIRCFGVRRIVRVGTCASTGSRQIGDVLIAQSASTDSNFNRQHFGGNDLSVCADFALLRALVDEAALRALPVHLTHVFSTDLFYGGRPDLITLLRQHRIDGVEMESAGLYGVALREMAAAAAVFMVSDRLDGPEKLSGEKRERGFYEIGRWVLDSLLQRPDRP